MHWEAWVAASVTGGTSQPYSTHCTYATKVKQLPIQLRDQWLCTQYLSKLSIFISSWDHAIKAMNIHTRAPWTVPCPAPVGPQQLPCIFHTS